MSSSCEGNVDMQEKKNFNSRKSSLVSGKTSDSGCEMNWPEQMVENQIEILSEPKLDNNETNTAIPTRSVLDEISYIFSLFHALIMTLLTIVFTVSNYTHDQVTDTVSNVYFAILLLIGTVWYGFFFIFKSRFCKTNRSEAHKSPDPSNRYLKGVLGLFGFAVIMSKIFELATTIIKLMEDGCEEFILIVNPVLEACFVTLQLGFLFHYAKLHIPKSRHMARFGLAHVLATNLSIWIRTISEETESSIRYGESKENEGKMKTEVFDEIINNTNENDETQLSKCLCNTTFCTTSSDIRHFLFPFQIEFCLISGCLIYILWKNVGRKALMKENIHKPCYSFLKSYKGLIVGAFSMVGTIISMVVLATYNTSYDEQNNFPQHIFDGLLMLFNVLILFSCGLCFFLKFRQNAKYSKLEINLDVVLLFVCLIGPFTLDLFSIVALTFGNKSETSFGWEITVTLSVVDILVNIAQVLLTAYGLSFLPFSTKSNDSTNLSCSTGNWNVAFQKEDEISPRRIQEPLPAYSTTYQSTSNLENNGNIVEEDTASSICSESNGPVIVVTNLAEKKNSDRINHKFASIIQENSNSSNTKNQNNQDSFCKYRVLFRDLIFFLVMVNVSLWTFFSFNGTIYKVNRIESQYYGLTTWLIFKSVAAPFAIYFRMHLAACLFELWTLS